MLTRKRQSVPRIGGLPASRHSAIALSLLCAITAAGIIFVAIGNYRKNVQKVARQQTVLIATSLIPKGSSAQTAAAEHRYRPALVLESHTVAGAITDGAMLQGRFAAQDILPGQQLTIAQFTTGSGIAYQLSPDQRAVSLSLDGSHGNVGVIQAGDHVDVYGSYNLASAGTLTHPRGAPTTSSSSPGGSNAIAIVRLLAANAVVLRAPSGGTPGAGLGGSGGGGVGNIVVAITQTQTPDLEWASDWGKVWLALRPANAPDPAQSITDIGTLAFGIRTIVVPHADGSLTISGVGGLVPGGQVPSLTSQNWVKTLVGLK